MIDSEVRVFNAKAASRITAFMAVGVLALSLLGNSAFAIELNTQRVSEGGTVGSPVEADSSSDTSSISADGRYIAYDSDATNLVAGDTNGQWDIFITDTQTHTTTRVSEGGTVGSPIESNGYSTDPSISADGRYVVYESDATNLVAGDTNGTIDVFLFDTQTHTTTRVSEGGTVGSPVEADDDSDAPSISADGRFVAYVSDATNLVAGDTGDYSDIYLTDTQTHTTTRVSEGGTVGSPVEADDDSDAPSISADGRFVTYGSDATNIVATDTNGYTDFFVTNTQTHSTSRISQAGTVGSPVEADGISPEGSIAANGRSVVYVSVATNLVAGDTNGFSDIFTAFNSIYDDGDNIPEAEEDAAPNSGDGNDDGSVDSDQANVTSTLSPTSNKYVVLESTCTQNYNVQIGSESAASPDANYNYPAGLIGFTLRGCTVGGVATITQYYFGDYDLGALSLRKWQDTAYKDIPGATLTSVTIGGQSAIKVVYQITDGSSLDDDGIADGNIVDPAGMAVLAAATAAPDIGAPSTGLQGRNMRQLLLLAVSALGLMIFAAFYNKKHSIKNSVK